MKQSILFCAVYLGRISFAFTTGDFIDYHSVLARRQAAPANVQRRDVDDLTELHVRNLLFPRTGSGHGSPRAGGGNGGRGGGGGGSPPRAGGGNGGRGGGGARGGPFPVPGAEGSVRVGPGRINLERASSLGDPSARRPVQRSSPLNPNREEPLPPDAAKGHIKIHGPGTYGFSSAGPTHRAPAGREIHKAVSSGETLNAIAVPYEGGKSTIHMTGKHVYGHVEATPGQGTAVLQTYGRNAGQTKIAVPGQSVHVEAEAAPGETVGVKVKAHGPLISGAIAHP